MTYDPPGMITRRHFHGYKAGCQNAPPPLHVLSANPAANYFPLPRPMPTAGMPGPTVVIGGTGLPSLGVDPTDPATWSTRGYNQSVGMIARFNLPTDWMGLTPPGGQGVRPS